MAQVANTKDRFGDLADMPKTEVKVGDWVCFKCDIEQSGRITKIVGDQLHLTNENGFDGEYIGGRKTTVEDDRDCWI